jgi:protein O-mannosyl-transferase
MVSQQHARSGVLRVPRAVLVVLTATAFANATVNGFVWLDHWQVESAGLVAHSWVELWHLLQEPLGAMPGWQGNAPYARPCVVLLLSLVHSLAGTQPAAYHLTLELIHLANVLLAYSVLSALRIDDHVAFLAAALFAVHPLQTAAVSWISGIADPLFTVFTLLALRLQLEASGGAPHGTLWRAAALLSFVAALGAKETAAIFPFLLAVTYVLFPASLVTAGKRRGRGLARALTPYCVVLIGAAVYRLLVLHAGAFGGAFGALSLGVRLRTLPRLLLSYVTLPLRVGSLTVCDDYLVSTRWDASTALSLVVLAALSTGLVYCWRRQPHAVFGVLWMVLGLLPVLNVIPILHYRADRFFYFPLIGWSLAAVVVVRAIGRAAEGWGIASAEHLRRAGALLSALGVLLLVGLTMRRNAAFADDVRLFEATLQVSPSCREARTALGDAYLRAGRYADAVAEYEQARTAQPDRASYVVMPKVLINLGMAQLGRGDYGAAVAAFTEAHGLQPELLHPLFGLGIANLGLGQVAAAATWLEQAYALAPNDPDVVLNLALSYDRLGRYAEALTLYRRYLDTNPRGRARAVVEERMRALTPLQP